MTRRADEQTVHLSARDWAGVLAACATTLAVNLVMFYGRFVTLETTVAAQGRRLEAIEQQFIEEIRLLRKELKTK